MSSQDRPLLLHISALSPEEYKLYTTVLAELAGPGQDDNEWDRPVDVMEARGWIRGRYGLDAAVVDKILRYFPTTPGRSETLSAGQFFAVLRLVVHAQAGRDPAKALVFVQANVPLSDGRPTSPPLRKNSLSAHKFSPGKPPPPPTPTRPRGPSDSYPPGVDGATQTPTPRSANPFRRSVSVSASPTLSSSIPVPPLPDSLEPNNLPPGPPPVHPLSRSAQSNQVPEVTAPTGPSSESNAPTLRRNTNPFGRSPNVPTSVKQSGATPPLPPRKPPTLPPRGSESLIVSNPSLPPRPPPKPGAKPLNAIVHPPIATSELMKQSLRAAKTGQAQKANEAFLEKTLNWEVIKRSSSRDSTSSSSPFPPPVALRRTSSRSISPRRKAPSPPASTSSLEVIASARLPLPQSGNGHHRRASRGTESYAPSSRSGSSVSSVLAPAAELMFPPPVPPLPQGVASTSRSLRPSHPSRSHTDTSTDADPEPEEPLSPSSRMGRSKSLHQPSSSRTTLPPPPRRRPESIQVLSTSSYPSITPIQGGNTPSPGPGILSRRASLQQHTGSHQRRSTSSTPPPPATAAAETFQYLYESVKKKAETFQPQIQDGFESVRRMAEGRVVPGGYARRGAEGRGLFDDKDGDGGSSLGRDDSEVGGVSVDEDWSEWDREGTITRTRRNGSNQSGDNGGGGGGMDRRFDREELKLPVSMGEGWRRL